MMKKEKGFTLIELLAVIIILAAIALIIAPLVLDIIREQQKKTFKESINGILRSSRLEIVNSGLSFPATFTYSDGKLLSPTGKELKVTGKIPDGSGSVRYISEDDIDLAIHDNSWCGTYNKTSKEVDVNELDGECVLPLVYTPNECFEFDGSTGAITDYKCVAENEEGLEVITDVAIPKTIDGVEVKKIGEYAFESNQLTSVTIPNSVTSIGNRAFCDNQLTSVVIPESVTSIGTPDSYTPAYHGAFQGNQLESIILGSNLEYIGPDAFLDNQLTSIKLPDSLTTIAYRAFGYNQLTTITIPSSVTSIGDGAFSYNQLTSVTIKGKSSKSDFTSYGNDIWNWAEGYSDSNIIWNG